MFLPQSVCIASTLSSLFLNFHNILVLDTFIVKSFNQISNDLKASIELRAQLHQFFDQPQKFSLQFMVYLSINLIFCSIFIKIKNHIYYKRGCWCFLSESRLRKLTSVITLKALPI